MLELIQNFFDSSLFIPHGHCYLWKPGLVWLHVLSDTITALAYYSIPVTLSYFVNKRKDFPFNWIFLLFAAFIVACGTTHLMSVWTLWYPTYWLSGAIKAVTAIVSFYTAFLLVPLVPQALALPSQAQLEAANLELQQQISERKSAEAALRVMYDELEIRVQSRTADLAAEIVERKRVELVLREMTSLQQAILDSANYTIISCTADGIIKTFNAAAERWLGYTAEEVVGKTTPVIIHDTNEVVQRASEISQELGVNIEAGFEVFVAKARRGEVDEREWSYIRKDGSRFPVMLSVTALRDAESNITGFVGIGSDISERKRSEERLRMAQEERRNLSKALESAVEGISQLDSEGRYLAVNPAYARITGYKSGEMIGMDWRLTVHPEDLDKLIAAYQIMLANGKVEVEAKGIRKDGSVFDKEVVMVKAYNQQREFIGHYCFMKDISDRREVERLKDEFVSVVSHELRTPLTSISGALDLLANGVLQTQPKEAQRMLNIAAKNTDRLVRLINDILDIERIESGKIQMSKQVCDASDLMTQSTEAMEEMAEQLGITLSTSTISARLWADPDRIIQVITNLLSNAIKFSDPGSTVCLSGEIINNLSPPHPLPPSSAPYLLFKVTDTGRGIPADKIESIFERFQQVDASDSRQKGGTGLGLAICRSILQYHGGVIWAESTLGEGSRFYFTLPILWDYQTQIANIDDSNTPLILECDDDPDIRAVVQTMLERQGYRVLAVASGLEAVQQAIKLHPSVILLNIMMPEVDGWETLAILKQQVDTQNIPVIILSGLLPDTKLGLPAGVSDWIVKPPNLRLLCQALEKALAKPRHTIRVLIIEDDRDLAEVLITMFRRHEIETFYAQTGREAIQISQTIIPDLLVLDLGLPECDGFAVVDWLRQHNRLCRVPLIIYTAQDLDDSDRQRLKLGQTLFLTKGRITPQEFEQRVINLLNRMMS